MNAFKKIALGTALAATALGASAPASARGYYGHHGDDAGAAVIGGVIGLALGAAIASSNNHYDRYDGYNYRNGGWYDGYRYDNGAFYDRQGYRRYDRDSWQRRHHSDRDRDGYRGGYNQYDNRYQGNGYNGGYYGNGYYSR